VRRCRIVQLEGFHGWSLSTFASASDHWMDLVNMVGSRDDEAFRMFLTDSIVKFLNFIILK